jgi:putative transposase
MWLEIEQAAQLLGISPRTVQNKIADYKTMQNPGKNGRQKTLIKLSSLPAECQVKYYDQYYQPDQTPDITGWEKLTDEARQVALHRAAMVKQAKSIIEINGRGTTGKILANLAQQNNLTIKSLYEYINWHDHGRTDRFTGQELTGIMALAPQYGRNKGKFLALDPDMQNFIQAQWLQPHRPSVALVYMRLQKYCQEKNIKLPSERTVHNFIRQIPEAVRVSLRIGQKKYSDQFEPVIRRDISNLQPNDIWVGDHREHDLFIYTNAGHKEIKRAWLTAFWDLASGKWVGMYWSFQPNSRTIALSLRNGILTNGLPKTVYLDNGKDYRAHSLTGAVRKIGAVDFDSETQGILQALNIEIIRALPYNARSKPIERAFRMWSEQFDQQLPGWCGRDNKARPEKLKTEIETGKLVELAEMKTIAQQFLQRIHATPYGDREQSPDELYKDVAVTTIQPEILDLLLMQEKPRKVTSSGIWLFDINYRSVELMQHVLVGQYVTVRYDPDDLSSIVVWDDKGRCLGRVPMDQRAAMSVGQIDIEAVKKVQTMKRHNRQVINEYRELARNNFSTEFTETYKEVIKQRQARDKDKFAAAELDREKQNVIQFFPASMEKLAGEIADSLTMPAEKSENVVPLLLRQAAGSEHNPGPEGYEPLLEE